MLSRVKKTLLLIVIQLQLKKWSNEKGQIIVYIIFNSFVITREQTDYPSCGRCKACSSLYVEQLSVITLEVSRRNTRPWFDRWDCKFLCRSLSRNVITWSVLRLNLYHPITFCRQKKTHQYSSLMSLRAVTKQIGGSSKIHECELFCTLKEMLSILKASKTIF